MGLLSFYRFVCRVGESLASPFLLAIRLFWGAEFFLGGKAKLSAIAPIIDFFQSLHIPFPEISAYLSASIEFGGGLLLLLGLISRLAALPLIFTMLVAYATAEIEATRAIFSDPIHFISRTPFTFLMASLTIFIFGPGKFSLDHLFKLENNFSSR